jgi:hypothetical protein
MPALRGQRLSKKPAGLLKGIIHVACYPSFALSFYFFPGERLPSIKLGEDLIGAFIWLLSVHWTAMTRHLWVPKTLTALMT